MLHQATLTNGKPSPSQAMAQNVGDLAHDIATLAELQAQLFVTDLQSVRRQVVAPLVLVAVGGAFLLACLVVALLGAAYALIEFAGWSYTASFLLTALAAAIVVLVLCFVAWKKLRSSLATLQRSREELKRNFQWLKQSLRRREAADRARTTNPK